MKKIYLVTFLFLSIITLSCSSDDRNNDDNNIDDTPTQELEFKSIINGGTYSNYSFGLGVYEIEKGTSTLKINVADINGDQITLFLNETGGFNSGAVKEMENIDSNRFKTFASIRQREPEVSYFSTAGSLTITGNIEHPVESGHRLISGTFNITASSEDGKDDTSMSGSFSMLDYVD